MNPYEKTILPLIKGEKKKSKNWLNRDNQKKITKKTEPWKKPD